MLRESLFFIIIKSYEKTIKLNQNDDITWNNLGLALNN